jgi:hypothetical protein
MLGEIAIEIFFVNFTLVDPLPTSLGTSAALA